MQGDTYQQEKQLEMIWSPQKDKGGHEPHSWLRMTEIQEGDRIFHYVKRKYCGHEYGKREL